jgi:hypothetical protein
MTAWLAVLTFFAGCILGALLVLQLAAPGPWPPERRAHAKRTRKEADSWLR